MRTIDVMRTIVLTRLEKIMTIVPQPTLWKFGITSPMTAIERPIFLTILSSGWF
jgi:hypothetical protein